MNLVKHSIIILLVIMLGACGKSEVQYDAISSGTTVVAFGDSVTYGYGVSKEQNYPTRLAVITGWNIINAGVSGERADQAKNRISSVLKQYQPKLVLIEIGGNDFLKRRKEQAVKEDIRSIINTVKAENAIPVLIAVPALSPIAMIGLPSDSSIYKELAKEENIILIDSVFSNVLRDEKLRLDNIHPNAQGYQQMVGGIVEQLRSNGLL
ncbi:GDSL-type esterase/lipase family protein [Entomomonas sp. E2T0]|uniref:GDSL-type esterase/lipase family protein n=1 Tax=Entomomonas sp. E2T0 TaxID=2930213 RepID=UPI0022281329|nr:GDSL-type esterase/lipase family protein [Entomomonas sp. E2T0]UYZ85012.1 GDSL-type esterase/lipase family protein [Entomomonas sp. E2T0]